MNMELTEKVDYLHDAHVYGIDLRIDDSGNRLLTIFVRCHPDCGLDEWNDKKLKIEFTEPLVILGELLGHMANAEEINCIDLLAARQLSEIVTNMTSHGISPPREVACVIFQSGSELNVACKDIMITEWT